MRRLCALLIAATLVALAASPAQAFEITGAARVVDGDDLVVGQQRVLLYGVDAPERSQTCQGMSGADYPCGREAIGYLISLVKDKQITCRGSEWNHRKRLIAECFVDGTSINRQMVRQGWAVPDPELSEKFLFYESLARSQKLGVWQGTFVKPWDWREGER